MGTVRDEQYRRSSYVGMHTVHFGWASAGEGRSWRFGGLQRHW